MEKKPFVTKEQLEEIAKTYPTPFYFRRLDAEQTALPRQSF